jgi:tetratricopeptide (TPR) repeat protein
MRSRLSRKPPSKLSLRLPLKLPFALLTAVLLLGPALIAQAAEQLGAVHFASSGPPEAQEPFQQGVAALHSFFYDEAADFFREAQRIAPGFAMAYWGEAMTYNHPIWRQQDREAARAVLERLAPTPEERAAKAPTPREKAYLAAVETLYGDGEKEARDRAYEAAMQRVAEGWPEDPEATAFYALAIQGSHPTGAQMIPSRIRSAALLEELFDNYPEHPGVLHYLIHAYDDPLHAPLGLRPAVVYAEVAPAAHHALHMPSHIFVQLGMWERVASSNEDAWQASVDWTEKRGHSPAMRDFHSLSWLAYAYLQLGRYRDAEALLTTMEEVARETGSERVAHSQHATAARIVVEEQRWPELEFPDEPPEAVFAAGMSAARRGEVEEARRAEQRLAAAAEGSDWPGVEVMAEEMAALARQAEGDSEAALAAAAEAAKLEEAMDPPSGPPFPVKPAHELYGEILLAAGQPEEAGRQLETALTRMPNRVLSLLAAARAADAAADPAAAREHYAKLARIWQHADEGIPAVLEVRMFLEGDGDAPGR